MVTVGSNSQYFEVVGNCLINICPTNKGLVQPAFIKQ